MSCLFNSLSYFIDQNSTQIRNKICNYLQQNKPIINGLDTKQILRLENRDYINNMRKPSTWGGAIEIQVACTIWNLKIVVNNLRDKKKNIEFFPIHQKIDREIHISWNGFHYEPIRN